MSPEELQQTIDILERIADDRQLLASLDREMFTRLMIAAGRVSTPSVREQHVLNRARRKHRRKERRDRDETILSRTTKRRQERARVFATPRPVASPPPPPPDHEAPELTDPARCYVCKDDFTKVHHFYDQMCPTCAEVNWSKRHQTADLAGRVALITGARVKIGYQAAIKLLRAGAEVLVTTRFPRDATTRYRAEADAGDWLDRLHVHGLDLRHTPSVEALAGHLDRTLGRLDFVIHNACQTVRRPAGWYDHLLAAERRPFDSLDAGSQRLLASHHELAATGAPVRTGATPVGVLAPAELSQIALTEEDLERGEHLFPEGLLDQDLQQLDLRDRNSWRLTLAEVSTVELLEVHLINAIAPFVLNARLKPLMTRDRTGDKHIVNVSAVEGQFYRSLKTDKHPHTNMAKAALNMMTRTSAVDYAADGIHMNSVDTGWVTDEDPVEIAARKTAEHGFHPPLDIVDGAARILDPIFDGLNTGRHAWGVFLKDYRPTPW